MIFRFLFGEYSFALINFTGEQDCRHPHHSKQYRCCANQYRFSVDASQPSLSLFILLFYQSIPFIFSAKMFTSRLFLDVTRLFGLRTNNRNVPNYIKKIVERPPGTWYTYRSCLLFALFALRFASQRDLLRFQNPLPPTVVIQARLQVRKSLGEN